VKCARKAWWWRLCTVCSCGLLCPCKLALIGACGVLEGVVSVCLVLFNKLILSVYHFEAPSVLLAVHMCIAVLIIYGAQLRGYVTYPPLTPALAKQVGVLQGAAGSRFF
jgi:hypothetical protein